MSQSNHLVSKAIEMQQDTIENSQRAMQQAVEFPMEQTVEFQKSAAEMMLNGLELGRWAQRQGIDFTNDALTTYITTVENAVQNTEQAAESGMEAMQSQAQQIPQQMQ